MIINILVFGIFGSLIFLLFNFSRDFLSPISLTIAIMAVFVASLTFQPVLSRLQYVVDRGFFRERYDPIEVLKRFPQETKGELGKTIAGVIHAVSLVVETRDPYTACHQRRVAELARAIARELGLSAQQVMVVHVAGLLHDVGKVAVPAEILSKPGKISQYEFSIIKNHCQIGYEILQRLDFPRPITQAILQHHERLNGSGYPEGLSGEEIALEGRILGVADVVEAMSSHRPYRPALGLECALQEISQASGVLYDSEVVTACLKLLKKNEPEFDRLMASAANHEYAATVTW